MPIITDGDRVQVVLGKWDLVMSPEAYRKLPIWPKNGNGPIVTLEFTNLKILNRWIEVLTAKRKDFPSPPETTSCCECGEPYLKSDLIDHGFIYCSKCRLEKASR